MPIPIGDMSDAAHQLQAREKMKRSTSSLAVLVAAAFCLSHTVVAAEPTEKVHPLQIVQFKAGSYACNSKEALEKASEYAHRNEQADFREMFSNKFCIELPKDAQFKVLRIANIHPAFDVIEVTNAKNTEAVTGMFAEWDY